MGHDAPSPATPRQEWWCNFCGYRTDDREAYLVHSCLDELAARGHAPAVPTTTDACR